MGQARWKAILAWLLILLALPAAAADKAELFKCVDAKGATSIQSAPCAKGSTQVWRRDATPEAAPTPEQQAQAQARKERDQRTVRELGEDVARKLAPPAPTPARPPEAPAVAVADAAVARDRCGLAQDFAAQLREKSWLELSDDQVRRLYAWVATQCQPEPSEP